MATGLSHVQAEEAPFPSLRAEELGVVQVVEDQVNGHQCDSRKLPRGSFERSLLPARLMRRLSRAGPSVSTANAVGYSGATSAHEGDLYISEQHRHGAMPGHSGLAGRASASNHAVAIYTGSAAESSEAAWTGAAHSIDLIPNSDGYPLPHDIV